MRKEKRKREIWYHCLSLQRGSCRFLRKRKEFFEICPGGTGGHEDVGEGERRNAPCPVVGALTILPTMYWCDMG